VEKLIDKERSGGFQPPAAKVNNKTTERTMPGKSKSTNWPKS
jgi:hypothetical protein